MTWGGCPVGRVPSPVASCPASTLSCMSRSHVLGHGREHDPRPIGVFDSGVGGLTVARALMDLLPDERVIYFGDTARGPYGSRDLAEVRTFTSEIVDWLAAQETKLVVAACNTATAAALDPADPVAFPLPVVGVIEP